MQKLFEAVKCAENIILLPHDNIDGDAFCSCQALKLLLESMGKKCTVLAQVSCIKILEFLELSCEEYVSEKSYEADLVIAVDCADKNRLGERVQVFENAENTAVIDHHKTNRGFGKVNLVVPSAAAACQVIFSLYKEWGIEMSPKAAECIFCGIVTDTGGFRYSNTDADTLEAAANLLKMGVDAEKINLNIFENKSFKQLAIEAVAIEKTRFFHGGKTAICFISEEMQKNTGASDDEMSNISSIMRTIEGVEVSVVIKERDGALRVSMRSKEVADVSEICESIGGGGHARAAGATMEGDGNAALETLAKMIGEYYERCNLCI